MAKVKYRDVSPGMQKMVSHKIEGSGRTSVGYDKTVGEFYFIEVNKIIPFSNQARKNFDSGELENLAQSIREVGICQPLIIIPSKNKSGFYEVLSGERRLRAAKMVGLEHVPCLFAKEMNKVEQIALIENIQRSDLHPIELGNALKVLLVSGNNNGNQKQLAQSIGVTEAYVSEALRLVKLPEEVSHLLVDKNIRSRDFLRKITKCDKKEEMVALINNYLDENKEKQPSEKKCEKIEKKKDFSVLRISYVNNALKIQPNGILKLSKEEKGKLRAILEDLIINM